MKMVFVGWIMNFVKRSCSKIDLEMSLNIIKGVNF